MKKIVKVLAIFLIVFSSTTLFTLNILTRPRDLPTYIGKNTESTKEILERELSNALSNVSKGENFSYNLSEKDLNDIIYSSILEYFNEDFNVSDKNSVIYTEDFSYMGKRGKLNINDVWVECENSQILVFLNVKIDYLKKLNTQLRLDFDISEDVECYKVEFSNIKVGNVKVPKFLSKKIFECFALKKVNILGKIDIENNSYSIDKGVVVANVLNKLNLSEDYYHQLANYTINILYDNELFETNINDNEFQIKSNINLIKNTDNISIPGYLNDFYTMDDEHIMVYKSNIYNKDTAFEVNLYKMMLLNNEHTISFNIEDLNKFLFSELKKSMKTTQEITLNNNKFRLHFDGLYFDILDGKMTLNGIYRFNNISSKIKINIQDCSVNDNKLEFKFNEITIGEDKGYDKYLIINKEGDINSILSEIGTTNYGEFTEEGNLVFDISTIQKVLKNKTIYDNLIIDGVNIENDELKFKISGVNEVDQKVLNLFDYHFDSILKNLKYDDFVDVYGDLNNELISIIIDKTLSLSTLSGDEYEEELFLISEYLDELSYDDQLKFYDVIKNKIKDDLLMAFENIFVN